LVYPADIRESQDNTQVDPDTPEPAAEGDIQMEYSSDYFNK